MSENKNFPENQIDQNQHLIENQSYEHEEENLKELPQRGEETDSTMNIKSFSNFESIKDSVKMENLKSPNTEIQDINIPQMNEDFIEEQVISNNLPKSKDDHNDFENNFYHTRKELKEQSEALENQVFVQSHNSTMLMESVQDNQTSQMWGNYNKIMMKFFFNN